MKLLTKEIMLRLPPLLSTDGQGGDAKIVVKFFDPTGSATWWVTEGEEEGGDWMLFGYADLRGAGREGGAELGHISLNELKSVKGRLGLGIERDIHYGYDHTLKEVM